MRKSKQQHIPAGAVPGVFPQSIKPMLMHAAAAPFCSDDWIFELKLDGMRGLAHITNQSCKLFSKNMRDRSSTFPALVNALSQIEGDVVLDGEIVAHDESGKPSLDRLEERWFLDRATETQRADSENPVTYYAFDLLHYNGYDLRSVKLKERKKLLHEVIKPTERIKVVEHFPGDGKTLFNACEEMRLEGVVAKRLESAYCAGIRSNDWLKIKVWHEGSFLIIGYRQEDGFLLAQKLDNGELRYAGSVFAGLRKADQSDFTKRLQPRDSNPLARKFSHKETIWFEPTVRIIVRYQEQTQKGILRSTIFMGFDN
jgi:DNA ligase D-like protein (predicted ligase)